MEAERVWLFSELIEKDKRIFKIPVYQRNYDWSSIECEQLYSDIIEAYNNNHKHFMGTVVYIISRDNSILSEALIIDGQQRITTVYILLKAIYDKAKNISEKIKADIEKVMYNRNCSEEYKVKLKPVKTDNEQLLLLLNDQIEDMDKKSNVYKNYMKFKGLIENSVNNGLGLGDILQGIKFLELVEIVLDKSQGDEPQKIFESINSTGVELCLSDLIRNYLLMDDDNQDVLYNKYWVRLEQNVGYSNLGDFFINYINSRVTKDVTNKNAYELFKEYCKIENKSHETILIDLVKISRYYGTFIGENQFFDLKISNYLLAYNKIKQTTILPLLFRVLEDYDGRNIDQDTLCNVLDYLLTYLVRLGACENSKNLNKIMKSMYSKVITEDYENYYEKFVIFLNDLKSSERMPTDMEFMDALLHKPLYKKAICKYILSVVENSSKEQIDISNLTIEHILPQKENAHKWKKELGSNYSSIYQKYLHCLGNLTITGHNSKLGVKSLSEKQDIIRKNSKANILNKDVLSAKVWNEAAILKRAESLANILLKEFDYVDIHAEDEIDDDGSFAIDEKDFTDTKPTGFSFLGEYISVSSWIQVLDKFLEIVYDNEPQTLLNLAERNYSVLTAKSTKYLSIDKEQLRKPKEVKKSGIFYCSNLSTQKIASFIISILEIMGVDPDWVKVSLKGSFNINNEDSWDEPKIGMLFYKFMEDLIECNKISLDEIKRLKTRKYTQLLFKETRYPAIADDVDANKGNSQVSRYRKRPLKYNGINIYITTQFYEPDREAIIEWYKGHK